MLGLYISGHPLQDLEKQLELLTNTKISEIYSISAEDHDHIDVKVEDGQRVVIGGIITNISIKSTRNNEIMAFIKIEDMNGTIEVLVFPKTYQKCSKIIMEDNIVIVKGRVSIKEEEQPKIIAEEIEQLRGYEKTINKLYIRLDDKEWKKQIERIKPEIIKFKGLTPIYIVLKDSKKILMASRELWVEVNDELIGILKSEFGEDNIKVV